jgi:UDP-N-acetylglucosamine--N-acetylmuramyl-(pentapeptide) pyrophosphoryl-undecaprenol N-acetylglucosamine transferase
VLGGDVRLSNKWVGRGRCAIAISSKVDTVLLAASKGGHLQELVTLRERVVPGGARAVWITSPSAQTTLLGGDEVVLARHAGQRDVANVLYITPAIVSALRRLRPLAVVSTGAAIALAALPAARAFGVEAHYIESAARTAGPSLTGRLASAVPGVYCYTQWPEWAHRRWLYAGSVFDGFQSEQLDGHAAARTTGAPAIRRIVVTLGTQQHYGFTRLISKVLEIVPATAEVFWQVRDADAARLGIVARSVVPSEELADEVRQADVVVAHAGIGSVLSALQIGKCPVLVPRDHRHGEHVDEHQSLIGVQMQRTGLAIVRTVEELSLADLEAAAARRVTSAAAPPARLGGRLGQRLAD